MTSADATESVRNIQSVSYHRYQSPDDAVMSSESQLVTIGGTLETRGTHGLTSEAPSSGFVGSPSTYNGPPIDNQSLAGIHTLQRGGKGRESMSSKLSSFARNENLQKLSSSTPYVSQTLSAPAHGDNLGMNTLTYVSDPVVPEGYTGLDDLPPPPDPENLAECVPEEKKKRRSPPPPPPSRISSARKRKSLNKSYASQECLEGQEEPFLPSAVPETAEPTGVSNDHYVDPTTGARSKP
jgi:hypothetical protein